MPTYQYRCTNCGQELEVVQRFSDDPLTVCEKCNGTLRKVFSAVGVVFKGSGFYSTDNHTSGSSNASAPSREDKASSAGSDSSASASPESSATTASSTADAVAS
jgi:hypothetical protein